MAQEAPVPGPKSAVDENGVDLSTGRVDVEVVEASIQSSNGGMAEAYSKATDYGNRHRIYVIDNFSTKQVVLDGATTNYEPDGANRWVSADGGVLTAVIAGGTVNHYLLTAADGTAVKFGLRSQHDICGGDWYSPCSTAPYDIFLGTEVTRPNGSQELMQFATGAVCQEDITGTCVISLTVDRIERVTGNDGLELRFLYQNNNAPTGAPNNDPTGIGWDVLTKIQSVNLANDYCAPYPATCTGTSVRSTTYPNAATVRNAAGQDIVYSYDYPGGAESRLSGVKLPGYASNNFTYSYLNGRVWQATKDGVTTTYTFTDNFSLGEFTANKVTGNAPSTYVFDYSQNLLRTEGPDGVLYTYTYDSDQRLLTATREDGLKQEYVYDDRGNILQSTVRPKTGSSLSPIVTSASFDSTCTITVKCNSPNTQTDALGNVTNLSWDPSHGGLLSVQAPAPVPGGPRPTTSYTYATFYGSSKNSSGILVPYGIGQIKLSQTRQCLTASTCTGSANEVVTTYEYNHPNLMLTKVTVAAGDGSVSRTVQYGYDARLNLVSVDGPETGAADTIFYSRDVLDRVRGIVYPDPDGTGPLLRPAERITYDSANRVSERAYGSVSATNWTAISAMVPDRVVQTQFDVVGRPIQQKLASGGMTYSLTQTSYDWLGRTECVAQRLNPAAYANLPTSACVQSGTTPGAYGEDRIAKWLYETNGRVDAVKAAVDTDLEQTSVDYQYNTIGELAALVDANGNKTAYTYDGFGRGIKVEYPSTTTPGAVNANDYELVSYNPAGNILTSRNRAGETMTFGYDNLGRLTSKQLPARPGLAATYRRPVFLSYDLAGNLTSARFDSATGEGLTYTFNALGQVTSAVQALDGQSRTISYQYDTAGRRSRITHPDGRYWQTTYDRLGRPTVLKENATTIANSTYGTDGMLSNRSWPTATTSLSSDFDFDAVGRFVTIGHDLADTSNDVVLSYERNPAGQVTDETISNQAFTWDGHVTLERDYDANALNQYAVVGSDAFCYDGKGNLTADGTSVYLYDIENRLVEKRDQSNVNCASLSYSGTLRARLRYDPFGRLYETSGTSGTVRYLYDGLDLVGEYNSAGTLQRRYVHGSAASADDPLIWYEGATVSTATRRLLIGDQLGSIIGVTDFAGALQSSANYEEFGIPGTGNIGRFRFTGQLWLEDAGISHYKARAYSPTLGRFLQNDPLGYIDGMNSLTYAGNDAVNVTDFLGLEADVWCTEVIGSGMRFCQVRGGREVAFFDDRWLWNRYAIDQYTLTDNVRRQSPPTPLPQSDLPKCDSTQRAGQWLGNGLTELGGYITNGGLIVTGAGVVTAVGGGLVAASGPQGFLPGLAIGTAGLNITAAGAQITGFGGLVTVAGGTISALSGSGKDAAVELASRVTTRVLPNGPIRDYGQAAASAVFDAVIPEINSCQN